MKIQSNTNYEQLLITSLADMKDADPLYRPTNFWNFGVRAILRDFFGHGLENFKSWPSRVFFVPHYGYGFTTKSIEETKKFLEGNFAAVNTNPLSDLLTGRAEAIRDWDVARSTWNQERWPVDFNFGESAVGKPNPYIRLLGKGRPGISKAFMNYLLLFSLLSRHVDNPPESFVEIGGGYGAAADVMFGINPQSRYINYDIPPLSIVSQYYMDKAHPRSDYRIRQSWELPKHDSTEDVFINSFSMQEMEPNVVSNYIRIIAKTGPRFVVSLNSFAGKNVAKSDTELGVRKQVTSDFIEKQFTSHGYQTLGRYREPFQRSAAVALIMKKK
ncbi:putative sugar O-methyltransferase [uncultured Nitratireductor sp.]|uniref:putative sugar O-methyltransferase n=1 Tax=uncultured Nitratireductor sp. TaxID=520953 RepID=UPI0025F8CD0E|nr:putative sugar O-methyltransferase [uncultured Nitratireductor sp.]